LRRRFGMSPPLQKQVTGLGQWVRWALSLAFKALKLNKSAQVVYKTEFDISKAA
jgi:hypothetical protein